MTWHRQFLHGHRRDGMDAPAASASVSRWYGAGTFNAEIIPSRRIVTFDLAGMSVGLPRAVVTTARAKLAHLDLAEWLPLDERPVVALGPRRAEIRGVNSSGRAAAGSRSAFFTSFAGPMLAIGRRFGSGSGTGAALRGRPRAFPHRRGRIRLGGIPARTPWLAPEGLGAPTRGRGSGGSTAGAQYQQREPRVECDQPSRDAASQLHRRARPQAGRRFSGLAAGRGRRAGPASRRSEV